MSNHGGRQEESGRGTLESLPEVIAAVADRLARLLHFSLTADAPGGRPRGDAIRRIRLSHRSPEFWIGIVSAPQKVAISRNGRG